MLCSHGSIRMRTPWLWRWSTRWVFQVVRAEKPNTRAGFVRIGKLLATDQVVRVGIGGRAN